MTLNKLVLAVLLIGLFGFKNPNNTIIIKGKIIGSIPEKIEQLKTEINNTKTN